MTYTLVSNSENIKFGLEVNFHMKIILSGSDQQFRLKKQKYEVIV